jgi:hypothetical protein
VAREHIAAPSALNAGPGEDQRDVQGRIIGEDAVRALAVLAEPLAVSAVKTTRSSRPSRLCAIPASRRPSSASAYAISAA